MISIIIDPYRVKGVHECRTGLLPTSGFYIYIAPANSFRHKPVGTLKYFAADYETEGNGYEQCLYS